MTIFRILAQRTLQALPTLLIVGTIVFLTMRVIPGDPAMAVLGDTASKEQLESFRVAHGLDQPALVQYFSWFLGILRGDFGTSYFLGEPVLDLILQHMEPTIANALLALAIVWIVGIPIGIYSATRAGTFPDKLVVGTAAASGTIPSFLTGLLLIALFAVTLRVLPSSGYVPLSSGVDLALPHMILPATALALTQLGYMVRMVRSSVLEELSQSYIMAQRSRGYGAIRVVTRAFRNAAIPLLTVSGQALGLMIAGAVIVETVFTVPGLGQLTINAISRGDFALLSGVVMFIAMLVIIINLVVDITYSLLDPRVRSAV